jgi:PKD repeat protein
MKKLLLFLVIALTSITLTQAQCFSSFTFNQRTTLPIIINFSGHGSDVDTTRIVTGYLWDFGDGTTGTSQSMTHQYAAAGTYQVCLTITTNSPCTTTTCQSVTAVIPPQTITGQLSIDSTPVVACPVTDPISYHYYGQTTGFYTTDSTKIQIIFGDGTDTIFYARNNPPNFSGYIYHRFLNPGTYASQLILTAPNGAIVTYTRQPITIVGTCGNVSGKVYLDNNLNCIFDAGDSPEPNVSVLADDGTGALSFALTDNNGDYTFNLPAGPSYTISCFNYNASHNNLSLTCPAVGNYTITGIPSSGLDFGYSCPNGFDLTGSVYAYCLRPGFIDGVYASVYNLLCNTPAGTLQITFPPDLTPLPDSVNSYSIAGNTITFPFNAGGNYWSLHIPVQVNPNAVIGTNQCITANVIPIAGDADPANNTISFCTPITSSFDPNDKKVSPSGVGPQGYIRPATDLVYTIDFQNTGTAAAVNIYLLDTISPFLDLTSLKVLSSSHPVITSILTGNILRFEYNNINLPDSNSNEVESHGYVTYKISQKNTIPNYTEITNTAGIYFDFNAPVITNTTLNTIDYFLTTPTIDHSNEMISIAPNPSNTSTRISFQGNAKRTIQLINSVGEIVFSTTANAQNINIPTSELPTGIYLVQILVGNNTLYHKKLSVVH